MNKIIYGCIALIGLILISVIGLFGSRQKIGQICQKEPGSELATIKTISLGNGHFLLTVDHDQSGEPAHIRRCFPRLGPKKR